MWFDEGTRSKFQVLGKDHSTTLLSLVDSQNLPRLYGGELDWKYEDEPNLGEDEREAIGETAMPRGPLLFIDGRVVRPPFRA